VEAFMLGAKIDDAFLPDLAARKKFAASRVPRLADIALDELLGLQPSRLSKKIEGAQVIIVRSQEIDHAGEGGLSRRQQRRIVSRPSTDPKVCYRRKASAYRLGCLYG
jgi:hypothetical protein